jgi:hypothetical protein
MTLRLRFWALGALAALVLVGDYSGAIAKEKSVCEALKAIDPDNDGTVDLNEAKKAASALFDKLDTDKDGTLTTKELQGRLSRNEFKAANPVVYQVFFLGRPVFGARASTSPTMKSNPKGLSARPAATAGVVFSVL